MRRLVIALLVTVAGCHVNVVEKMPGATDPELQIGQRRMVGYRVLAGASTTIPPNDIGYLITADGHGTYRVVWIDTANSPARFSGSITTDGSIDVNNTFKFNGNENITITPPSRIDFDDIPGDVLHGVDLVTSSQEIYLDASVNGSRSGFGIYFTGAGSGDVLESPYDPVAFTSP
jgi:hypothetical protein